VLVSVVAVVVTGSTVGVRPGVPIPENYRIRRWLVPGEVRPVPVDDAMVAQENQAKCVDGQEATVSKRIEP
jgi:hypothetical protein